MAGIDDVLSLEAIYYSSPVPRDTAVLTILGAVFDKIHFPGVVMPVGGFDQAELNKEIARIANNTGRTRDPGYLLSMLRFIEHAKTLEGFCVFGGDKEEPFKAGQNIPQKMVRDIYDAIHGPLKPGWEPMFSTSYHKGMPGSDEAITYPGEYHYFIGAVVESAKTGIPLLNDLPGLPIPGLDGSVPEDDARTLATILAIETTKLILPSLPVLRPEDIMEFRAENTETLRAFRRSMLRYAADLNKKIAGIKPEEFRA